MRKEKKCVGQHDRSDRLIGEDIEILKGNQVAALEFSGMDFAKRELEKGLAVMRTIRNQSGFTLIEVMLTLVVFAIGAVGALAMSQSMLAASANSDFRVTAGELASEKIEQIIGDKTFKGYTYITNANYPVEALTGDFSAFTRSTAISEVSTSDYTTAAPGSGMKRVTVTVSWTLNGPQTLRLTTLLSEDT